METLRRMVLVICVIGLVASLVLAIAAWRPLDRETLQAAVLQAVERPTGAVARIEATSAVLPPLIINPSAIVAAPRTPLVARPTPPRASPVPETATPLPAPERERRIMEVEYPPRIKLDDTDTIRLTLRPLPAAGASGTIVATVEQPGHEAEPQVVSFPAPFETHDIIAQARLTSSGLRVVSLPAAPQPLRPGQPNTWRWIVVPERAGRHQVLIGVDLQYTPKRAGADAALSPQRLRLPPLAITVVTLFGLSAAQAKLIGTIGAGVSFAGTALTGWEQGQKLWAWMRGKRARRER